MKIRTGLKVSSVIGMLIVSGGLSSALGQEGAKNTDFSPDKALKSNARVNPSTLAMELSVPLGVYPGRAGNSMPITFDYTSKVWTMRVASTIPHPSGNFGINRLVPAYSRRMAAGWTSSLSVPHIAFQESLSDLYMGADKPDGYLEGQAFDPVSDTSGYEAAYNLYYIKRVNVTLADGSSHEFRADEQPIYCGTTSSGCAIRDYTGTYYSVDGTRMSLVIGTTEHVLKMPDGGRYFFGPAQSLELGSVATGYTDRNGNKITYSGTGSQWTDTMGRQIGNPLPVNAGFSQDQVVDDDQAVQLPGLDGGVRNALLKWEHLSDNTDETVGYLSDKYCGPTNGYSDITDLTKPKLFLHQAFEREQVCNPGSAPFGSVFDPVVLTSITLPNGQSYQFKYNNYGEIKKITYPTGGYERFSYAPIAPVQESKKSYDQSNRGVSDRWVSASGGGSDEVHWTYTATNEISGSPLPYTVTVNAPDGSRTEQLLYCERKNPSSVYGNLKPYGFGEASTGRPYEDRVYSTAGVMLKRHFTAYETTNVQTGTYPLWSGIVARRDMRPVREISIVFEPGSSNALATMSETTYDTSGNSDPAYFSALNPKASKTYHYVAVSTSTAQSDNTDITDALAWFQGATAATLSEMTYLYDANYKARNINGLVTETKVLDPASPSTVKAKTQIGYDEVGTYPLIATYSSTRWDNPATNYRGLTTTVRTWTDITSNLFVETHAQYDQMGNLLNSWDGRGNLTQTAYSSTYDYAYPTSVTSPVPGGNGSTSSFVDTTVYDYSTGLPTSTTDANSQVTTISYKDPVTNVSDPLLCVRKVTAPNGHQTITEYGAGTSSTTRFVKTRSQIDASSWKEAYSWFDGLGRTTRSQSVDDDGDVFVETQYDNVGRAWKTTNPYRNGETVLWTEQTFDSAGRLWKVTTPDGAFVESNYSLAATGSQVGSVVTVTDQAGKQRRSIINALGNVIRVDEPTTSGLGAIGTPNQGTQYTFDVLNNLISVVQGTQTRSFAYDALSRLTSATNPESGIASNTYDGNGNVITQRDARGIKTILEYDALNRLFKKCFKVIGTGALGATSCLTAAGETSDSTTSEVNYFYDSSTVNFSKGRLTKIENGFTSTHVTSFDVLGNVTGHKQVVDGVEYPTSYSYNLGGALVEEIYPSGRAVKNEFDASGDLARVLSKKSPNHGFFPYAGNFTYAPSGRLVSMKLGNNAWESVQLNSRLQPTQIAVGTTPNATDIWKINYEFGELQGNGTVDLSKNNSNIGKQIITVPTIGPATGFTAEQTFTYDHLKRIKIAIEKTGGNQTWKQTFNYDQFGNRTFDTANTTTIPGGCSAALCNPAIDATNNRIGSGQGYTFDAAGNVTQNADNKKLVYDARNKLVELRNASTDALLTKYYYDGDGIRTKIEENGVTTVFVYDAFNRIVAEYAINAPVHEQKVNYLISDLLGTPRVITDENRLVFSRRDLTPFGEEISVGTGGRTLGQQYSVADGVSQKFTGQERDNTAKLDYFNARSYSYSIGRFMSADSVGGKLSNPQSFNLYAYTLNNPLKWVDPSGHAPSDPEDCKNKEGEDACTIGEKGQAKEADGDDYVLPGGPDMVVNVNGDGVEPGPTTSQSIADPPPLPSSWTDFIPVYGSLRGMAYYMNCRTGGCNFTRATGNFALLSWELTPFGAAARAVNLSRNALITEVISETTETGSTALIRTSLETSIHGAERIAEREFTEKMASTVIKNGEKFYDPLNKSFVYVVRNGFASGKDALVATNVFTGSVNSVTRGSKLVRPRFVPMK